jgi:hypothetical protein
VRALVLTIAALVAVPTLARAQERNIEAPRPTGRGAHPGIVVHPDDGPRTGYGRPPRTEPPRDGSRDEPRREHERRGSSFGGRRRSRPVVILVAPYDGYGYAPGDYQGRSFGTSRYNTSGYGSATTTTYTGSYAPLTGTEQPERADTTYVRYEPGAPANATNATRVASPAVISLAAERLTSARLRLRWTGREPGVREVTLVVADASRRVLATQTVRSAPWSAVFDNAARVVFLGTTVLRADGVSTTTLVPIDRVRGATVRKALPPIRRTGGGRK